MVKTRLRVKWIDRGFDPKNPPDPAFPNGMDMDISKGQSETCSTDLPYPAKRCGYFLIDCLNCGMNALVTTAGRPDDPRSIKLACKGH